MSEEPGDPAPSEEYADEARRRWREDRTTFQRVYDVVTGLTEYAPVGDVADRAACSDDGARDALSQLVEMGVAEKRDGRPATYRRNESYFRWRRVEELSRDHSAADLRARVEELLEEDEAFQERFDTPDPDAISPTAFESVDHEAVHERWDAVSRWRSVRNDVAVLQQAVHRAEQREGTDVDDAASV